ncbi:MAG: hypothetical protein IJ489_04055 [Clostridia bacterium]|nr:hypothetical protein [Clostridia bacterium]
MSSENKKFKRGFLDGFAAIFQDDPSVSELIADAQEKDDTDTPDKRAFSVFVARKIRDNYMDICADLPFEEQQKPAQFILHYLKDTANDIYFERKPEQTLLGRVFDEITEGNESFSVETLFRSITDNITDSETPAELALAIGEQESIQAVSELRALCGPYEKDPDEQGRAKKYALMTEIKKLLSKSSKEGEPKSLFRDFAKEKAIVSKALDLCFDMQGYGKTFWDKLFRIFSCYLDRDALDIAAANAFIDAVFRDLFMQKQVKAKYRNVGNRNLSDMPETKNVFPQDLTFKDISETYYITRLLLSMNGDQKSNFKEEFETNLKYHSAYISTASTSRFPAETGRLFEGTTNATGKNTQCTKQLLAIFAFCYFEKQHRTIDLLKWSKAEADVQRLRKEEEGFANFCSAARIHADRNTVFTSRNIFSDGFDSAQRDFLMKIFDCINAVPRDFLYIFETTQRIVNAPNREQKLHKDDLSAKDKTVFDYMKSNATKLESLCSGTNTDDSLGSIALLRRNAENIVRICEGNAVQIPEVMIENAVKAALSHEIKEGGRKKEDRKKNEEKPETIDRYFMNDILKNLEEKYNEAAESDFLCTQLLQRQDYATVRTLLFRFARYNDFTNECTVDIDLLEMRNELLQEINDVLIANAHYQRNLPGFITESEYCLNFADRVFADAVERNLLDANDPPENEDDPLPGILEKLMEHTQLLYKNDPNKKDDRTYRFRNDLDRLMLAGVGFARKYDGSSEIIQKFIEVFERSFYPKGNNHLRYSFEPFMLFGTVVLSYLSHTSRKKLIYGICETVYQCSSALERAQQEASILLLNNTMLQKYIPLSYHERKMIFDCIFATNIYPKQLQAYSTLKKTSFYAEYARREFERFLSGEIASPIFIYLAAAEAPKLPEEKQLSTRVSFALTGNETLNDYFHIALRMQYLSWTKNKHEFEEATLFDVIRLAHVFFESIMKEDDVSKRKFALGTQMLLVALSNLIRSERLPEDFAEAEIAPLLVRSEYLQRSMNTDYMDFLNNDTQTKPNFWLLCGGLRYIAATYKRRKILSVSNRVHLTPEETELFEKCLLNGTRTRVPRFFMMDHRLVFCYTDAFDQNQKLEKTLVWDDKLTKDHFLDYDNMDIYFAYRKASPKKQKRYLPEPITAKNMDMEG